MSKTSLKTQNVTSLSCITLFCLVSAWLVVYGYDGMPEMKKIITALGGSAVVGILSVWIAHLVPQSVKHALVFCRIRHALPGHRFISLSHADVRVDSEVLLNKLPELRKETINPEKQNQIWYRDIYRPLNERVEIAAAHGSFLLYRDAAMVILILIMGMLVLAGYGYLLDGNALLFQVGLVLTGWFLLLVVAANNAGKRFVTTAVSIFTATDKEV